jgi:hypothetical protein
LLDADVTESDGEFVTGGVDDERPAGDTLLRTGVALYLDETWFPFGVALEGFGSTMKIQFVFLSSKEDPVV